MGHSRLASSNATCSFYFRWTFSRLLLSLGTPGTVTPECGTAVRHSRRGVTIILQILSDLLHAAYNQRGLLAQPHCLASNTTGSLLTTVGQTQGQSKTPPDPLAVPVSEASGLSFCLFSFSFVSISLTGIWIAFLSFDVVLTWVTTE